MSAPTAVGEDAEVSATLLYIEGDSFSLISRIRVVGCERFCPPQRAGGSDDNHGACLCWLVRLED